MIPAAGGLGFGPGQPTSDARRELASALDLLNIDGFGSERADYFASNKSDARQQAYRYQSISQAAPIMSAYDITDMESPGKRLLR